MPEQIGNIAAEIPPKSIKNIAIADITMGWAWIFPLKKPQIVNKITYTALL
jgi:hypothetical protein